MSIMLFMILSFEKKNSTPTIVFYRVTLQIDSKPQKSKRVYRKKKFAKIIQPSFASVKKYRLSP